MNLAERLAGKIRRDGPVPFDWFVERALYDPRGGFYTGGRGAGRAGRDFVTSPEVGPLFGLLVGRAIDRYWETLGQPDPFVVVEAGAGGGRLAREVLRAEPACLSAMRYVLVERSAALRAAQRELLVIEPPGEAIGPFVPSEDALSPLARAGPVFTALDDLPARSFEGVVLANELLDNLPFGIAQWSGETWEEIRVGLAGGPGADRELAEVVVPAAESDAAALNALTSGVDVPPGARMPIERGVEEWLRTCAAAMSRGVVVLIDYMDTLEGVIARGPHGWLRTYRGHASGGPPLEHPGSQDITADVVSEQLVRAARSAGFRVVEECSQSDWLSALGVEEMVESGRAVWGERARLGDVEAIAARSSVTEAAALTDPASLGAHRVVTLSKAW